ncbi:hypothetical protein RKE32_35490 [Streptomyces sp. Li-HN-5-13]|nr:hypothetical protein RKE32_35490 [Streptomyces sp. Li-HN-5-13]
MAVLAAVADAPASALQRKAAREEPADENLSPRLIWRLLHRSVWFGGITSVIAGFLLIFYENYEKVRGGLFILLAVLAAAALATAVMALPRSPLLSGEGGEREGGEREDADEAGRGKVTGSGARGGGT